LSFSDKNKITQNLVEPLIWSDEESGENSLKALIDQRIKVILDSPKADWDLVFEDQLMRGSQPKYKHMAARTYLRPRDMIQCANLCLKEAQREKSESITNQDIAQARPAYSRFLVTQLDDEVHPVAPEWRRYMDALRRIHTMRFRREDFAAVYDELRLEGLGLRVEDSLELLYRFSIIGFTKIGGAGYGGSAVAFKYRSPDINFDPAAPVFTVHPGLKEALELIESSEKASRSTASQ
jgi:hypothetical protein